MRPAGQMEKNWDTDPSWLTTMPALLTAGSTGRVSGSHRPGWWELTAIQQLQGEGASCLWWQQAPCPWRRAR